MLIGWLVNNYYWPLPHSYEKFCLQLPQQKILTLNPTIYHNFHVGSLSWTMVFSHFTYIWSARVTVWWSFQIVGCSNQIESCNSWLLCLTCHCGDLLSFQIGLTSYLVCFIVSQVGLEFSHFFLLETYMHWTRILSLLTNVWSVEVKKFWVLYFCRRRVTNLPSYCYYCNLHIWSGRCWRHMTNSFFFSWLGSSYIWYASTVYVLTLFFM